MGGDLKPWGISSSPFEFWQENFLHAILVSFVLAFSVVLVEQLLLTNTFQNGSVLVWSKQSC